MDKHPHLIHQIYRPDIDGLRAVAILSVVIFHTYPSLLKGGFVGVDIFFVISGYLISKIIFSSLERERFSIVEFYVRRIRRIFPALILVMVTTLVIGWFILFAPEFKQLGKHVAGGATFLSNFILWTESGYFNDASTYKPLLHLWSLGIEEQFYIVWPLLLTLVWKRQWGFLWITAVIAIVSFSTNVYLIDRNPVSAFYLPTSRFWELMLGGLLSYMVLHRPQLFRSCKSGQSFLGLSLLGIALLALDKGDSFPGWWALLPTLGTFFIISAGPDALFNKKILSNRLMIWIGLISYPLYLWHWVLLSFLRIEETGPSRLIRFWAIVFSFVLAGLTYKIIEAPFRNEKKSRLKAMCLLLSMILVLGAGYIVFQQNGLERWGENDRSEFVNYYNSGQFNSGLGDVFRDDCNFYNLDKDRAGMATPVPLPEINKICYTRNRTFEHAVFLWGDSHAQQLFYGLEKNIPANWQILVGASSGCHPDPDVTSGSEVDYCKQSNWFSLKNIAEAKPDVVIVAQDHDHNIGRMNRIVLKLKKIGVKRIIFTGPVPKWSPKLPYLVARKLWFNIPRRTFVGVHQDILNEDARIKIEFIQKKNVLYLSLIDFFCNKQGCLTYIGNDRMRGLTSPDYGHLTPIASDYLAKKLLVKFITGSAG